MINRKSISTQKDYNTPPFLSALIKDYFGVIHLDPCSNEFSFIESEEKWMFPIDGLNKKWFKNVFVNPPYGREVRSSIADWLQKCSVESKDCSIIALVPVATNTVYWRNYVWPNAKMICFLYDTRLKFWLYGNPIKKGAPMACCLILYGSYDEEKFRKTFENFGKVIKL